MKHALIALLALTSFVRPIEAAQDSRADVIAQQQAEKSQALRPYEASTAERVFLTVKEEFIDTPAGFYPLIGSVYSGGGAAFGGGYRGYYGDRTFWDAKGMWSIRNYKWAELSTTSEGHVRNKLTLAGRIGWLDAPDVANFGIGPDTPEDDDTDFELRQAYAGGALKVRPISWIPLGAGTAYENYQIDDAPGFTADPEFLHTVGSAGIDWRPAQGYARRGGLYELRYHHYRDFDRVNTFDLLQGEVAQHLPILRENWVVGLRGLANTVLGEDDQPPFFLLPSLGGASTLRGYPSWRFRDRHSILFQGEFRWVPNRHAMDMAVFYDAGKVTSDRGDLNFKRLRKDIGAEVRFHTPTVTPLRIGIAHGDEGWSVVFAGSATF